MNTIDWAIDREREKLAGSAGGDGPIQPPPGPAAAGLDPYEPATAEDEEFPALLVLAILLTLDLLDALCRLYRRCTGGRHDD